MRAPEIELSREDRAKAPPDVPMVDGGRPGSFSSVLFEGPSRRERREAQVEPACFADLYLNQVVAAITAGRDEYRLAPLIWRGPVERSTVVYRQEVFEDLRRPEVAEPVRSFARAMRAMRDQLAQGQKPRLSGQY